MEADASKRSPRVRETLRSPRKSKLFCFLHSMYFMSFNSVSARGSKVTCLALALAFLFPVPSSVLSNTRVRSSFDCVVELGNDFYTRDSSSLAAALRLLVNHDRIMYMYSCDHHVKR